METSVLIVSIVVGAASFVWEKVFDPWLDGRQRHGSFIDPQG